MQKEDNFSIGLFENINDQIFDCDTIAIDDKYEIHRYVLKNGEVIEIPFYSNIADIHERIKKLNIEFNHELPKNSSDVEEFYHQILDNLQSYFILKEYDRYTYFTYGNQSVIVKKELKDAEERVKKMLKASADLAPLWWHEPAPKYPDFRYQGANPYNILGWDNKFDDYISKTDRNIVNERMLMLKISKSYEMLEPTEKEVIETFRDLRILNIKRENEKKKVLA